MGYKPEQAVILIVWTKGGIVPGIGGAAWLHSTLADTIRPIGSEAELGYIKDSLTKRQIPWDDVQANNDDITMYGTRSDLTNLINMVWEGKQVKPNTAKVPEAISRTVVATNEMTHGYLQDTVRQLAKDNVAITATLEKLLAQIIATQKAQDEAIAALTKESTALAKAIADLPGSIATATVQ